MKSRHSEIKIYEVIPNNFRGLILTNIRRIIKLFLYRKVTE